LKCQAANRRARYLRAREANQKTYHNARELETTTQNRNWWTTERPSLFHSETMLRYIGALCKTSQKSEIRHGEIAK
jgi:hypothetical protein